MSIVPPPPEPYCADSQITLEHYLTEVVHHYHPGRPGYFHPRDARHEIWPLWKMGEDKVEEVLNACQRRTPPKKWLTFELCQIPSRAWHEWHWTRGLRLRRDPAYESRARRHIPDALRLAVYERDDFACLHCGATEALSLDHIHPCSLGGEDTFENLQTLCRPCNSRKGARV